MENRFIRVRSTKDIVICTHLLAAGLLLVTLPVSEAVGIAGFFILFAGLLLCLLLKTGYKDVETGVRFYKTERFFAQDMRECIKSALTSPKVIDSAAEDKGNGLRLDIYYSQSADKSYAQLNEYVPYKYEPCSKYYEFNMEEASKLLGR